MSLEQTQAALATHPVQMEALPIDRPEGANPGSFYYQVMLTYQGRTITTHFHCGYNDLSVALVMNALLDDYHFVEDGYEAFCANTLFDPLEIASREKYNQALEQMRKADELLYEDLDIFLYGPDEE